MRQQKRKEKEDKRAQQVVDSFIMVERTTQRLLVKRAKAMFSANWSTTTIKKTRNRFHKNFAIGLKTHPLLYKTWLTLAMEHKLKGRQYQGQELE
jgi:hypothetical protein